MVFTLMRTFDWFITAASRQDSLFTYGRCSNAGPGNSYRYTPGRFAFPFLILFLAYIGACADWRACPALSKVLEAIGGKEWGYGFAVYRVPRTRRGCAEAQSYKVIS